MKYSKEFLEANARLKTLDEEALNDELNKMSFDELLEHRDYMIQQELGEENQLSEEEAQEQIEELLQMTREPSTDEIQPIKIHTHRTGKRIAVLIAAILIMVSVFTVAAVASKRDFSILNGIVRFEDGKIIIALSDAESIAGMSIEEFESDLAKHGFESVKLPRYFYSGSWAVKEAVYHDINGVIEATASIADENEEYSISIFSHSSSDSASSFILYGSEGGETINCGDLTVYLFDHGNSRCEIIYNIGRFEYAIRATSTTEEMREIANTVF